MLTTACRLTGRTRPQSHLGVSGGSRGARREPQHSQKKGALRLPAEPQRPGGNPMTAEVAVMNKSAVALAADSKVTIGGGRGSEKTYDTMNKIFTLSKVHPVGIMIFGSADFMEFPWETIIKQYRKEKRAKSEKTIDDWGGNFCSFLKKFGPIRERDRQYNIRRILSATFSDIEAEAIFEAHVSGVAIPSPGYEKLLVDLLNKKTEDAKSAGPAVTKSQGGAFSNKYWRLMFSIIHQFFQVSPKSKVFDAALETAVFVLLSRALSNELSGFVIAGFGESEAFPALVHYSTDGYVGSKLKLTKHESSKINRENPSAIAAFAQHDIVQRFMEGIDAGYAHYLRGLFRTSLIETNLKIFEKWAPKTKQSNKIRKQVENASIKQYENILRQSFEYREETFENPIMDMISILPKDEIGHLAESLMSLTSLHRRVSREMETVGGPIDVAIISKFDGFIWLKRKHYFRLELNRQFELNYMRDLTGGRP